MKKAISIMTILLMVLVSFSIAVADEATTNTAVPVAQPVPTVEQTTATQIICSEPELLKPEFERECSEKNGFVVKAVENGCVVGYVCQPKPVATATTTTPVAKNCPDIYSTKEGVYEKCKKENMQLAVETDEKGCIAKYICKPFEIIERALPTVVGVSPVATSVSVCVASPELLKEFYVLMESLKEAEKEKDTSLVENIKNKIDELKSKMSEQKGECTSAAAPTTQVVVDRCNELKNWKAKRDYYKTQLDTAASEEKTAEIKRILEELEKGIIKIKSECKMASSTSSGGIANIAVQTTAMAPVAVQKASEITDYYKLKVSDVMGNDITLEKKVSALKEIRTEIDKLIEELIKNKNEFRASEVKEVAPMITVKPTEIIAGDVTVQSTDKRVLTTINNKELVVVPFEGNVLLKDGAIEVTMSEVNLKDDKVQLGNKEVKIAPSDAVALAKATPTQIELKTVNEKPVYEIKAEQKRKIIWLIPVMAEKTTTVDAQEGTIVKESLPWWSAISSAAE